MATRNEVLDQLTNEYEILHLAYHRNRNQHRLSFWWKYFNILHRHLRKIIMILIDLESTKSKKKIASLEQRLKSEYLYLKTKKIFSKCYYEFNGIIVLGQFINLGLTLIGSLAKISTVLDQFELTKGLVEKSSLEKEGAIEDQPSLPQPLADEDLGNEVEDSEIFPEANTIATNTSSDRDNKGNDSNSAQSVLGDGVFEGLNSKKKKKKKKKKSDIDAIFG